MSQGISIFFVALAWCTAIDVHNAWNKPEEEEKGPAAVPTEATPLNIDGPEGRGGNKTPAAAVEGGSNWKPPCLPGAPPRTVTNDAVDKVA